MGKEEWRKKKRSAEGSIKTIKGNLYARIQWIDEGTGKRKEKLRRADNRTVARQYIKEMTAELNNYGENTLQSDKMTFNDLATKYEQAKLVTATYANGIKVSGKRSLLPTKSALKPLVEYFGRKSIRLIKPSEIENYKNLRLKTPVETIVNVKTEKIDKNGKKKTSIKKEKQIRPRKISSVNRELELLRAIMNFAKREGMILQSPFERSNSLISKAAENERDRILSFDEEKNLLAACSGRREHLRPLIITAVDTGARRGELFKLRWRDIDWQNQTITIRAENAKTEKARTIGLTSRMKIEFERLWKVSPKDENELVFGITNTIKNAWRSACEAAGIKDLHFHDLRHTATTRFIRAGVPHTELMKLTGHTQMKTFLRYLNPTNESVVKNAGLLSDYLERQTNKEIDLQISASVN